MSEEWRRSLNEVHEVTVGTGRPKAGDVAPDFELPDQLDRTVRSADLRAKGSLVIALYRGHW